MKVDSSGGFMNKDRNKAIIQTSILGIIANLLLSILKVAIGLLTKSIAITLDAINNLSDACSSIITIIGTKLASKLPDKKHPFGHGRIEYFSSLIIGVIVLYAGVTSFGESVKNIVYHEIPNYSTVFLIIIGIAVAVKIILGRYFINIGKRVNSPALENSGKDALLDSIISFSTLITAVIFINTGISLEAYLGVIISIIIVKSGLDMLMETISRLLGEGVNKDLARKIVSTIREFDHVIGVYDLILNDYGPNFYHGSVHIEVPDTYTANELDELNRKIYEKVLKEHNVYLTAIGVYSYNTKDKEAIDLKKEITSIALNNKYVNQIHGFYYNEAEETIRFDLVINFETKDRIGVYNEIIEKIKDQYPMYKFDVAMDTDFTSE